MFAGRFDMPPDKFVDQKKGGEHQSLRLQPAPDLAQVTEGVGGHEVSEHADGERRVERVVGEPGKRRLVRPLRIESFEVIVIPGGAHFETRVAAACQVRATPIYAAYPGIAAEVLSFR